MIQIHVVEHHSLGNTAFKSVFNIEPHHCFGTQRGCGHCGFCLISLAHLFVSPSHHYHYHPSRFGKKVEKMINNVCFEVCDFPG